MLNRRTLSAMGGLLGTLFAVSLISFLLIALLPGDLALTILGNDATPERIAALRLELGLNDPLAQRYLRWLGNVLQGDFGRSIHSGESTLQVILSRVPVTVQLVLLTQVIALIIAVPLGIISARRKGSLFDHGTLLGSLALLSTPSFVVALVLVYFFALKLQWLPATGFVSLSESFTGNLKCMLLPVLSLALVEVPIYLRLLRSEMITTLQQNFILLAKGMGIPTWRILWENALRPSSLSLITAVGINMGRLMGGAVVVETLFALPGMGQLLVESIYQQEYLMTQGIVLLVAFAFIFINITTDLLYALLDPRLQREGAH